jgi:hypothetical protein
VQQLYIYIRTLCENYKPYKYGNYLLPCCGNFFVKELNKPVLMMGCNKGIDWTIEHIENMKIKHISENGSKAIISEKEYRKMVYQFNDKVKSFYDNSILRSPGDKFDEEGYNAFIDEWNKLYRENHCCPV